MNRPLLIAALGFIVVASAIALNFLAFEEEGPPPALPAPPPITEPAKKAPITALPKPVKLPARKASKPPTPQAPPPPAPGFDVVRVNPHGDTVIAGRAEPGSVVAILDDGKPIGRIKADANGEWVFLPDIPLPPGNRRLSLEMRIEGFDPIVSDTEVVLVVPEREKDIAGEPVDAAASRALALAVPRNAPGPAKVLQSPVLRAPDAGLTVDAVDYDDAGNLTISGHAPVDARVHLYLNTDFLGRASSDAKGTWSLSPEAPVEPGLYSLRVDQVDDAGKVLARVTFPFSRAEPISDMAPGVFVVIQPGHSLWQIARNMYGSGFAYTVIFKANQEQIRDPDLIFPGQVFTLPKPPPGQ